MLKCSFLCSMLVVVKQFFSYARTIIINLSYKYDKICNPFDNDDLAHVEVISIEWWAYLCPYRYCKCAPYWYSTLGPEFIHMTNWNISFTYVTMWFIVLFIDLDRLLFALHSMDLSFVTAQSMKIHGTWYESIYFLIIWILLVSCIKFLIFWSLVQLYPIQTIDLTGIFRKLFRVFFISKRDFSPNFLLN